MLSIIGSMLAIVALTLSILIYAGHAPEAATNLREQQEALKTIADFADRICKDIPLTGVGENLELTVKAKADLGMVIK